MRGSRVAALIVALAPLLVGPPAGAAGAAATAPLAPLPAATPASEPSTSVLHAASRYAGLLRGTLPILQRRPDVATLRAALDVARRAVAEIDRLSANSMLYGTPPADREALMEMAARAHLHLALFETHDLEFDRARQEIASAKALSGIVGRRGFRTEWVALQEGAPGSGLVTRYQLLSLAEFEGALESIWARARDVPFEIAGYGADTLQSADLSRTPAAAPGSLEDLLAARGAGVMRDALRQGRHAFTAPLPPGLYRLRAGPGGDLDRAFIVPEVSEVDPIVIDRARFTLLADPRPGPHGPRFFLNGLEVTDLTTMPYGVYRVKVDAAYFPSAPWVVRFVLGEGISDKSHRTWTVFVPGDTPARFFLSRAPLGDRLFHR
jgi:hypothetical protein